MLQLSTKCWNSAINAQGSRAIIVVVHVRAVKIYIAWPVAWAADAIPNQNSVHSSSSGALKGNEGVVFGGGVLEPCEPILLAKWSNQQKIKVLCIKVHFVHFYPSIIFKNQMCPNTK
jgi:hypothetical protein